MTLSYVLGAIAASIGSVMALSPLLQARVIHRTRSSRDVSVGAMWIFVVNSFGWLAYGISMGSPILIVPNVIALIALSVAISVTLHYRREPSPTATKSVLQTGAAHATSR